MRKYSVGRLFTLCIPMVVHNMIWSFWIHFSGLAPWHFLLPPYGQTPLLKCCNKQILTERPPLLSLATEQMNIQRPCEKFPWNSGLRGRPGWQNIPAPPRLSARPAELIMTFQLFRPASQHNAVSNNSKNLSQRSPCPQLTHYHKADYFSFTSKSASL